MNSIYGNIQPHILLINSLPLNRLYLDSVTSSTMSYTPPAGPWASTTMVPSTFPAGPAISPWSAWVQGTSGDLIRTIQFITGTGGGKPVVNTCRMFTFGGGWNGWGYSRPGDEFILNLSVGERITSCTLWVNAYGDGCLGRVQLVTDKGQVLDTAPGDTTLGTGFSRPVGGGLLCGTIVAFYGGGDAGGIIAMCLLFLAPAVVSVSVSNMQYMIPTPASIAPVNLATVNYNTTGQWTFGGSKSRSITNSLTSTSTKAYTATASVEISGKFLGIGASATAGFEWTQTDEKSTESSVTDSTELNWSTTGNGPATCLALVYQGIANVQYQAQVVLTLSDNSQSSFTEHGIYNNVSYSQVDVQVTPTAAPPKAA